MILGGQDLGAQPESAIRLLSICGTLAAFVAPAPPGQFTALPNSPTIRMLSGARRRFPDPAPPRTSSLRDVAAKPPFRRPDRSGVHPMGLIADDCGGTRTDLQHCFDLLGLGVAGVCALCGDAENRARLEETGIGEPSQTPYGRCTRDALDGLRQRFVQCHGRGLGRDPQSLTTPRRRGTNLGNPLTDGARLTTGSSS